MKKIFLCALPLQDPVLKHYQAVDNSALQYDGAVPHPVLLLLRGYARPDDEVRLVVTHTPSPVADANLSRLKAEVARIQCEIGFSFNADDPASFIVHPFSGDESLHSHLKMLTSLIPDFDDMDAAYLDITFGTKPTPIVFTNLLHYVHRMKLVDIGCVCYGRVTSHQDPDAPCFIYDVTPLFRLTGQIEILAGMQLNDPDESIRQLLGSGDSPEKR